MTKNLKNFFIYRKIIKQNKKDLKKLHGISIDWVCRLYKTYNIPTEENEAIKNLGSTYLDNLLKSEIKNVDEYFISIGLSELVGLMEVVELNDIQVGIAFRYKYLNTAKIVSNSIWSLFTLIFGTVGFLLLSFLGLGIGLLLILIIYIIINIVI